MNPTLNCLSHWFPILQRAGLPVPRTQIVRSGDLRPLLDGKLTQETEDFFFNLGVASARLGEFPLFLRTGQLSGKHDWKHTCFLSGSQRIFEHVCALVEHSEMAGFFGLPHNVWCLREMLPTVPLMHAYNGMPVVREWRCFVSGQEVLCLHPYWPLAALIEGFPFVQVEGKEVLDCGYEESEVKREIPADFDQKYETLCHLSHGDEDEIRDLASRAGQALTGCWSVDILETTRGLYVTDVALAAESFHWEGCPVAGRFRP